MKYNRAFIRFGVYDLKRQLKDFVRIYADDNEKLGKKFSDIILL